ncbi:MAG: AAA family ATPase [Nitrososphaerales archaeon]
MLVITGNPGVGKHTIARIVARNLSLEVVDINEVAIKNQTIKSRNRSGYVVDLRKLSTVMRKYAGDKYIVVGHLAPYVLERNDACMVAVIRRSPYELKKVYKKRGYDAKKESDNLLAEIIGVCLYDSISKFGRNKVAEFDNTSTTPSVTAGKVVKAFKGKAKYSAGKIDWLSLIAADDKLREFANYGSR